MKYAILALTLMSSIAFAETLTYKVEGMHCAGCAGMIKNEVCKLEGLESCNVSLGKIVLKTKANAKIKTEDVSAAAAKAGEYTITLEKTK